MRIAPPHNTAYYPPTARPAVLSMPVISVSGNIFRSGDEAFAHCVSEDLRMTAGIALTFRLKYRGVAYLRSQRRGVGESAKLRTPDGKIIYYLITKRRFWQKPELEDLRRALKWLKEDLAHVERIDRVSIPRLGCGLDSLNWDRQVLPLLKELFGDDSVTVTVFEPSP
jgi:hypothetical protein